MLPPQRRGSFNKFMQQQDGGSAGALPPAARPDSPHSSLALPLRPNWRQTLASPHTCKWFPLHKYRLLKGAFASESPPLFFFFSSITFLSQAGLKKKEKGERVSKWGREGLECAASIPGPNLQGTLSFTPRHQGLAGLWLSPSRQASLGRCPLAPL